MTEPTTIGSARAVVAGDVPAGFALCPSGSPFIDLIGPVFHKGTGLDYVLGLVIRPELSNLGHMAHGGMLASFMDTVLSRSAREQVDFAGLRAILTVSMAVDYLAPAPTGGWVEGRARLLKRTNRTLFIEGLITHDGAGVLRGSATFSLRPAHKD